MSNINYQFKIFEAEKKAVDIYKKSLDRKITTSFETDCIVQEDEEKKEKILEMQLKLLKMIYKASVGYKNEIKHFISSLKLLKDKNVKNRLLVLDNIINNKRLKYLDCKESLNKQEKKNYLDELRNLRNKLYNFNNSYVSSIGRKSYSFSGFV